MTEFMRKDSLDQFLKEELLRFVSAISDVQTTDDDELDLWVRHFDKIVQHPSGRDLIFWPEQGADDSPEGIVAEIERYCRENGLPGFKDSEF